MCGLVNCVLVCVGCNWCVGVCVWVGNLCFGVCVYVWVGKLCVGVCVSGFVTVVLVCVGGLVNCVLVCVGFNWCVGLCGLVTGVLVCVCVCVVW